MQQEASFDETVLKKKAVNPFGIREISQFEGTTLIRSDEAQRRIFSLSNKALWLLTYILFNMKDDYVEIEQEAFNKSLGFTANNTLLEARKELIGKGIIARTGLFKNIYWVNVHILSTN